MEEGGSRRIQAQSFDRFPIAHIATNNLYLIRRTKRRNIQAGHHQATDLPRALHLGWGWRTIHPGQQYLNQASS
jgi:hypothetical protein